MPTIDSQLLVSVRPVWMTSRGPLQRQILHDPVRNSYPSPIWRSFLHSLVYELPTILCGLHPAFSWQL